MKAKKGSTPPGAGTFEVGVQELPDLDVERLGLDDLDVRDPVNDGSKDFIKVRLCLNDEGAVLLFLYNPLLRKIDLLLEVVGSVLVDLKKDLLPGFFTEPDIDTPLKDRLQVPRRIEGLV